MTFSGVISAIADRFNVRSMERAAILHDLPKGSVGVEVGVWMGDFSKQIVRIVGPSMLHLVDPWSDAATMPNRIGWDGAAMAEYVRSSLPRFCTTIHAQPSVSAACKFDDLSLDWVYIDGDHSEAAVLRDLAAWFPKIKPHGVIMGDDYLFLGVRSAVHTFCDRSESAKRIGLWHTQYVVKKMAD